MKKILSFGLLFVVSFMFITVVFAKSGTGKIVYNGTAFGLIESCGKSVTARFKPTANTNTTHVLAEAQKKVLIVWITQVTTHMTTNTPFQVGVWYPNYYAANASGKVRELWTNMSSGGSLTANFELY